MNTTTNKTDLRLAAIDIDGTLLGPDGKISAANLAAVQSLADAGLEIVLASGRHYHAMMPYAEHLPMVRWIVSAQGGEVSDRAREQVLQRHFLKTETVGALRDAQPRFGVSAICYTPEWVVTEAETNAHIDLYTRLVGKPPQRVSRSDMDELDVFKVVWIGDDSWIEARREEREAMGQGLQTVQTFPEIFEFMPVETSKASGLSALIDHLNLPRESVVVFGDGDNDIPMFEWAGKSFAMPHGWPQARESATHIGPEGEPGTALARAIERCRALYIDG